MPRPDLVEQANEDDAGDPLLVWTGEVIKTNDIALRLDDGDDTCIWPHGRACWPDDDDGEKQPDLQALPVLPDTTPTHRLTQTRIWPTHQPPFAVLATRP